MSGASSTVSTAAFEYQSLSPAIIRSAAVPVYAPPKPPISPPRNIPAGPKGAPCAAPIIIIGTLAIICSPIS
ncbi:unnamed protein product, partial [Nesidiocoris tenuis]